VKRKYPELTNGSNICLCSGCQRRFLNVRAFDWHRVTLENGERACDITPRTSENGVTTELVQDHRDFWRFPPSEVSFP